jgi:hypothetical protein
MVVPLLARGGVRREGQTSEAGLPMTLGNMRKLGLQRLPTRRTQ